MTGCGSHTTGTGAWVALARKPTCTRTACAEAFRRQSSSCCTPIARLCTIVRKSIFPRIADLFLSSGLQPEHLRQLTDSLRSHDRVIPLHAANLWLHRNKPGQRDQFTDAPAA